MIRRPLVLAVLSFALLAVPHAAQAVLTLEGFYGIARPGSPDFRSGVSSAVNDSHLFSDSMNIAGGDAIMHLGFFELGAIGDVTWKGNSASQTALGGLVGVGGDLGPLRVEALGEVGGHRYGNFTKNPDIVTASSTSQWLAYVGLRPGVAVRLGSTPGIILGVWGFARWDVTRSDVPVTVSSTTDNVGSLHLGGTTIGATARLGIDF